MTKYYQPQSQQAAFFVPRWLSQRTDITQGAKMLYSRLSLWAGNNGVADRSAKQLGNEIGASARSIQRYTKELQDIGLIETQRVGYKGQLIFKFLFHKMINEPIHDDLLYKNERPHGSSNNTQSEHKQHTTERRTTATNDTTECRTTDDKVSQHNTTEWRNTYINNNAKDNNPSFLDLPNGETRDSETPSLGGGGILDSGKNVTPSPDPVAPANQDSKSDEVDKLISAIPDSSPHYVATIITKYHDKLKLKPDDIPRFAKALAEKVAQKLAENNDGQINRAASMIGGQIKSGYWTYEPKGPTVRAILTPQEREFMSECKYYEQNGMNLMPEHIKARYLEIKARIAKNKPQAKGKPANDNGCSQAIKQLVQNVRQNTASRANL